MGKLLLTSSQVNVLITSVIVVLCTSALFLSGYVIQQRTLAELRIAIKPRPSRPSPKVAPNFYLPERFQTPSTNLGDKTVVILKEEVGVEVEEEEEKQQEQVIEVKPTMPKEQVEEKVVKLVEEKAQLVEKTEAKGKKQDKKQEKAPKHSWAVEHPDPSVKTEKPISRAERRRLIKEEIRRLAQADKPVYYQRRLW